jgi:hypothetical protein
MRSASRTAAAVLAFVGLLGTDVQALPAHDNATGSLIVPQPATQQPARLAQSNAIIGEKGRTLRPAQKNVRPAQVRPRQKANTLRPTPAGSEKGSIAGPSSTKTTAPMDSR